MNRFIIVDGLPYLYANGKTFAVRWDELGFTVGAEVENENVPAVTYSEISIMAKCANLDSIGAVQPEEEPEDDETQVDIASMKLDELKKYASDNGIKLNGARTKPEIIEAIKAASMVE